MFSLSVSLKPAAPYGRLEPRTELLIQPKARQPEESFTKLSSAKSESLQETVPNAKLNQGETTKELCAKEDNLNMGDLQEKSDTQVSFSSNILPTIWNLIGNIFFHASDKKQEASCASSELNTIRDNLLNLINMDSVFRVCQTQPPSVQSMLTTGAFQNHNTIHVFPWNMESTAFEANIKVSYAKMSTFLSPKQQHQESKQNRMLKRENQIINLQEQKQSNISSNEESNEFCVVQIVWNEFEDLKNAIRCNHNVEQLHVGRVWVSLSSEAN